jgi:phospho-N-acetylmuramoyl-pentapeptide-transferase
MLYHFLVPLSDTIQFFNIFRYLTFRTGGAIMTALVIAFVIGPSLIRWLKVKQGKGQPIREDGPQRHLLEKKGTPTMGGLMILIALSVSTLLWADLTNPYVWIVLGVTLSFGLLGWWDDYLKVSKRSPAGVSGRVKLVWQSVISIAATIAVMELHKMAPGPEPLSGTVAVPFLKDILIPLGPFFFIFGGFVIVAAGNAVNLTDGLDGLAIVPVMVAAAFIRADRLSRRLVDLSPITCSSTIVPGTAELSVVCGALIGAGIGFLWFNAPPAQIFHGRHRLAGPWRCARHHRGRHQARDRPWHHRRAVRARGGVGDRAGHLVQAHRQARLQDGAHPPPFRDDGLDGEPGGDPVLDHFHRIGADRALDTQDQVTP